MFELSSWGRNNDCPEYLSNFSLLLGSLWFKRWIIEIETEDEVPESNILDWKNRQHTWLRKAAKDNVPFFRMLKIIKHTAATPAVFILVFGGFLSACNFLTIAELNSCHFKLCAEHKPVCGDGCSHTPKPDCNEEASCSDCCLLEIPKEQALQTQGLVLTKRQDNLSLSNTSLGLLNTRIFSWPSSKGAPPGPSQQGTSPKISGRFLLWYLIKQALISEYQRNYG